MKRSVRSVDPPKVAVATLDAKAYYALTSLLKDMHLSFTSVAPGEPLAPGVRLVLTTRREKTRIRNRETLCLKDLIGDAARDKEQIFSILYRSGKDQLIVGVDPGERTGIAAYYRGKELLEEITRSPADTLSKIKSLIRGSKSEKKLIRIGDGNPTMAQELAAGLLREFGDGIEVEIVDERGTSTIAHSLRTRESRDLKSARMISFRRGHRYQIV